MKNAKKKKSKCTKKKKKPLFRFFFFFFFFIFLFRHFYIFFHKIKFYLQGVIGFMLASFIRTIFFNFDVFSTFILNILSFKVDFCYFDEQILVAVVKETSEFVIHCIQGLNI